MVPERSECLWVASTQFDRSNMAYINQSRNWYFHSELLIFSSNHLGPTFPQCFATSIVLATTSPRRSSLGVASRQGRGLVWEFAWTTPLATYAEEVGCFQGGIKIMKLHSAARFPGSLYISPRRKSDLDLTDRDGLGVRRKKKGLLTGRTLSEICLRISETPPKVVATIFKMVKLLLDDDHSCC